MLPHVPHCQGRVGGRVGVGSRGREQLAEALLDSDAYWECVVAAGLRGGPGGWGGGTPMGPGPASRGHVVDPELRVLGVSGLRVVGAAVVPVSLSAGTAVPSVMIAERAADLVKAAWGRPGGGRGRSPRGPP